MDLHNHDPNIVVRKLLDARVDLTYISWTRDSTLEYIFWDDPHYPPIRSDVSGTTANILEYHHVPHEQACVC